MIPDHLQYSPDHEWALLTETGAVRFGITDFAQESLGGIVFVTLPEVGSEVVAGEPCGEVESTKNVAEVLAPVSGRVTASNGVVETAPETLNDDPYGAGWIAEIEPTGPDPLGHLLAADEYEQLIEGSSTSE